MSATIEIRDTLQILAMGGGFAMLYTQLRTGLATLTTEVRALVTRMDRMESSRDTHTTEIAELREENATIKAALSQAIAEIKAQGDKLHKLSGAVSGHETRVTVLERAMSTKMPAQKPPPSSG